MVTTKPIPAYAFNFIALSVFAFVMIVGLYIYFNAGSLVQLEPTEGYGYGYLIVEKVTVPADIKPVKDKFEFIISDKPEDIGYLSDGENSGNEELPAGSYTITENADQKAWETTSECEGMEPGTNIITVIITKGQTVKCIFTNTKTGYCGDGTKDEDGPDNDLATTEDNEECESDSDCTDPAKPICGEGCQCQAPYIPQDEGGGGGGGSGGSGNSGGGGGSSIAGSCGDGKTDAGEECDPGKNPPSTIVFTGGVLTAADACKKKGEAMTPKKSLIPKNPVCVNCKLQCEEKSIKCVCDRVVVGVAFDIVITGIHGATGYSSTDVRNNKEYKGAFKDLIIKCDEFCSGFSSSGSTACTGVKLNSLNNEKINEQISKFEDVIKKFDKGFYTNQNVIDILTEVKSRYDKSDIKPIKDLAICKIEET